MSARGTAVEPVPGASPLPELGGLRGAEWMQRYASSVLGTYGTPKRVLVRGEGAQVWDADGRRYLDLLAGIATSVLGHAHPLLTAAVTSQLATLGHVSNFFATPVQVALAERLLEVLRAPAGSGVFFCNSGAEANEAAFKIARRTGRPRVIAAVDAFHGRTMGALSLTWKPAYREPFAPLVPGVEHVPYGDVDALAAAVAQAPSQVAAVVLEPVQGEAGVRPAPDGYLAAAREVTTRAGALLVLDEVQTGVARTGAWFAHQLPGLGLPEGVLPDVVTVAKGLGGGVPVGAAVALGERTASLLSAGQHGTTFGGNPVAAAAGLAVLHAVERDDLLAAATAIGGRLATAAGALEHPLLVGVRGVGALRALVLARPAAAALADAALAAGFVVNAVAPDAVRLAPPLVISPEQLEEFTTALPELLDRADAADRADPAGSVPTAPGGSR
ncbi:acetylornithine transaminase [Quadrisphaera sp. DSM 44207]|uniref:acetylornithine transaminase n=1 Tax=Quadrisphaera sp. DSM 44207 TaxID=1881057 RepID=UPI00087FC4C8|nr:acetylornithine transaminase [Quadrisphaera sp. DSM 44207]SDQ51816.1 acetylornithine aminotransferase apoenzyme [Quadrisphaera sp. DSM 44207]